MQGRTPHADDITMLTPTRGATLKLLEIAKSFSSDYDVNPDKSCLIVYAPEQETHSINDVFFCGKVIERVHCEKHLGNIVGPNSQKDALIKCIHEFQGRVNVMLSQFAFVSPWVKYKLFKSFCMPLYGS